MFILFDSWPKMGFDFFSNVWLILTLLLYVKKKKVTFSPGFLFAELVIPDKANVFYAMSTTANFDFVLRQQRKGQKKVLRASASLSRLVKWPPPLPPEHLDPWARRAFWEDLCPIRERAFVEPFLDCKRDANGGLPWRLAKCCRSTLWERELCMRRNAGATEEEKRRREKRLPD